MGAHEGPPWRLARLIAAAAAAACLALPAAAEPPTLTGPGPPQFRAGTLTVTSPVNQPGQVFLRWEGTIAAPMAEKITAAFEAFKSSRRRFVLVMNSGGGSVAEGEKVIVVLQTIRRTHRLDTAVERGARCGSMCVPVYLQGEDRFGARSSAWLFHEVTRPGATFGRQKKVDGSYMRLIERYWIPAGVSREWINRMLPLATGYDYWQTGDNLITDRAGIITRPIENRTHRNLEPDSMMPASPSAPKPPAKSPETLPQLPVSAPVGEGEFARLGGDGKPASAQRAPGLIK